MCTSTADPLKATAYNVIRFSGPPAVVPFIGLEHISISRCNYVSNIGFSLLLLSPLPHLKRIVVRKCPGVTEDGLREIAAKKVQLPQMQASCRENRWPAAALTA
jgi:hypothetical protein